MGRRNSKKRKVRIVRRNNLARKIYGFMIILGSISLHPFGAIPYSILSRKIAPPFKILRKINLNILRFFKNLLD